MAGGGLRAESLEPTEPETLREQARILRTVATCFEAHLIRQDLLRLAERCEELAEAERENYQERR